MDKKSVALLGLGSKSTLYYISELNRLYNAKHGRYSTFPFSLINADFNDINPLLPNPSEQLDTATQVYIHAIEKLDVTHLLIPNITLHETIDRIQVKKNIIHPIHLTISKLKQNNWNKVMLFGSLHTMTSDYIRSAFQKEGIEVVAPIQEEMNVIDELRKHVYSDTQTTDLIEQFHSLIEKYTLSTPVLLACTELSLVKPNGNNKLLDMAGIQIEEAVNTVLY